MKAMILAAGKGERLKPITNVTPKCLVYVNGKTLLERHFNMLVRSGVKEVVINLGWLGDKILEFAGDGCKFGLEIHYSNCLLYTSPSPRDRQKSRMPSSA